VIGVVLNNISTESGKGMGKASEFLPQWRRATETASLAAAFGAKLARVSRFTPGH